MQEYPLKIPDNRKVNIKSNTATKPIRPSDREDSSTHSNDKRTTTTNRRRQRHSTEIGSEYYRWWAVRSALGFQTNEHIAGLLLDGFHALLQHIVSSCGGDEYPGHNQMGSKKGKEKNDSTAKPLSLSSSSSATSEAAAAAASTTAPSLSSTFSLSSSSDTHITNTFSSSLNSPPGAEDMEGFTDFNQAIAYYTNALRWMCAQPDHGLIKLRNASPVLQEFLGRLNRYLILGGGRGLCLNDRKKPYPKESPCLVHMSTTTPHVNAFNIPVVTFAPQPTSDIVKPSFITSSHSGHANATAYPPYITQGLTPLMLPSKASTTVPKSVGTKNHHHDHQNLFKGADHSRNAFRIVGGKFQDCTKMTFSTIDTQPSLAKEKTVGCKTSFPAEEEPPNFLNDSPSKLEIETKYSYRREHDVVSEYHKWSMMKEYSASTSTVQKYIQPSSINSVTSGNRDASVYTPDLKQSAAGTWNDKNNNIIHLNETKPNYHFSTPTSVKEAVPRSHKGFVKDGRDSKIPHHTLSQGTPLLFVPTQQLPGASEVLFSTGSGGLTNVTHKFVYNSQAEGFYGQYLSNTNVTSSQKSQCLTYPPSNALQHSINQLPKQRSLVTQSSLALAYTPTLLTSRPPPVNNNTPMIPLFYSPTMTVTPKIQTSTTTTTTNVTVSMPWMGNSVPSFGTVTTKDNGPITASKPFICNQNNTMRDNFNLFRMYQDISKPGLASYQHPDKNPEMSHLHTGNDLLSSKKMSCPKSDFQVKSNPAYPHFYENQDKHQHDEIMDHEISKGHFYSVGHGNHHPAYHSKSMAKSDYSKENGDYVQIGQRYRDKEDINIQYERFASQRRNAVEKQGDRKYQHTDSNISIPFSYKSSSMRDIQGFSSPSTPTFHRHTPGIEDEPERKVSLESVTTKEECKPMRENETNASNTSMAAHFSSASSFNTSSSSSCRPSATPKPRRHVCRTCNKVLPSGIDLVVHRYEQHSHVCSECDDRFLSLALLQQHKSSDHPQMLVCPQCKFTTFCEDQMEEHKTSHQPTFDRKQHAMSHEDEEPNSNTKNKADVFNYSPEEASYSFVKPVESYVCLQKPSHEHYKKHDTDSVSKEPGPYSYRPHSDRRKSFWSKETPPCHGSNVKNMNSLCTPSDSAMSQTSRTYSDRPCSGSVFPSFDKSTSSNLTSSKVDSIVNIFSQVNDYCRFDQSKLLPSPVKEESNEADTKESILVIDTSSGSNSDGPSKDHPPESTHLFSRVNEEAKVEFENAVHDDGKNLDSNQKMEDTANLLESRSNNSTKTVVVSSADCGGQSDNIEAESRKRQLSDKFRKKRRKGQTVKHSSKKFKCEESRPGDVRNDYHQDYDVTMTTDVILSKKETNPSDFEINEESAHNSGIKPHTVWLDDCQNMEGVDEQNVQENGESCLTWSAVQRPINVNGRENPNWKLHFPVQKCHKENGSGLQEESDALSSENKNDAERHVEEDNQNNRILSLRERHRSHSLPPKKRSIQK